MRDSVVALCLALPILFGPGALTAVLAGVRGLSVLALAPALTYVATGVGAQIARWSGIAWGWPVAAASWCALALAAWAAGKAAPLHTPRALTRWSRFQWSVVAAASVAAFGLYLGTIARRSLPPASLSGRRGAWHDLLALISTAVPLRAGETGLVAAGAGVAWICSVVLLQRVVFPTRPSLAIVGAVGAVAYQATPAMMPAFGHFGAGAALALVPALLAWSVQLARVATLRSTGRMIRAGVLGAAFLGVWLAHPLGALAFLLFAAPAAVPLAGRLARQFRVQQGRWRATTGFGVLALGGTVVTASAVSLSDRLVEIPRAPFLGTPLALFGAVADWTPYFRWWPNLAIAGCVLAGVILAIGRRPSRSWLAVAFGVAFVWYGAAALAAASAGDAAWFADPVCLAALAAIPGIPLGSMAVSAAADHVGGWGEAWRKTAVRPAIAIVLVSLAACLAQVAEWVGLLTGGLAF